MIRLRPIASPPTSIRFWWGHQAVEGRAHGGLQLIQFHGQLRRRLPAQDISRRGNERR